MKKTTILLVVIVLAALYVWSSYNGFVGANESVDKQWAQVESQYQRRFDLIPNLVESVKGIMKQEQKIFGDLAEARTRYSGASTVGDKVSAANQVESALARLLVVLENYPTLKSAENVQTLMAQLEGSENRISVERQRFNDDVRSLNVKVKKFPGNIVASVFGFNEREYFESEKGAENAPEVKF
ncbi:MAG: LemA family protein [Candidatus Yanofskybacteria bacterium]|nr:LemA family protein [Candidatus Yanofskybacteria bacterium]